MVDLRRSRLSLQKVLKSFSDTLVSMFNIVLSPQPTTINEVWDSKVFRLDVVSLAHADKPFVIGTIYLDLFDRPDKPQFDAQFSIR